MRILKIGNCPSLSGNSNLTYNIGHSDQGDLHFQLHANTGGGLFSRQWIPFMAIEGLLEGNITGRTLKPLYEGKSINSPGFVLAILLYENLVRPGSKGYIKSDFGPFKAAVQKLIDAGVDLKSQAEQAATSNKEVVGNEEPSATTTETTKPKKRRK
ncbi:MAG: hypothetical protein WC001_13575 [Desulfurivibrionaceae bacterium]